MSSTTPRTTTRGRPPASGHDLIGTTTLGEFCERVDALDLFPVDPQREVSRLYRRWTLHSAALDLALRQAGRPLHAALGRDPQPLTFVVSLRLGEPPTLDADPQPAGRLPVAALQARRDQLLDAGADRGPRATRAVDSIDFKAHYRGSPVDQGPDPVLYRRIVEAFPDAWLEDPDVEDPGTAAALAADHDRITWDAPIHSIADIEALPFAPRMVNVKPSRMGGLPKLCAPTTIAPSTASAPTAADSSSWTAAAGRLSIWPSLFHADTPNDLSPTGFHSSSPPPGLPVSPLAPDPAPTGFRWGAERLTRSRVQREQQLALNPALGQPRKRLVDVVERHHGVDADLELTGRERGQRRLQARPALLRRSAACRRSPSTVIILRYSCCMSKVTSAPAETP